ncbi:DUF5671 domain-containing protein [Arthrobacter sp.]|uniref:DUF5671 domain-containing protein n=1 Tax=Arthrobacter sp. TaxID=1667 RepID=UPI0026DF8B6B|nr:DUF5671 domain-containing protein [Arthrobacter sp.]MDO5752895.1 DUF5671 domain-containing protein [Arthrobacter sp.]
MTATPTVRRLIVFTLLFTLVVIGAIGLAGLLGRLLETGVELVRDDTASLARSLAFTLIGGPFAAVLWWVVWRRAEETSEQDSLSWGVYVAGASTVSLVTFSSSLLFAAATLAGGNWSPQTFATGVVWAAVWLWHRGMSQDARRRPLCLRSVAPILGAAYGLVIGTGGAVTTLGLFFAHAIHGLAGVDTFGQPWWRNVLGALVWAAGGVLVWWWYWVRKRVQFAGGRLAHVTLAVVGILGSSVLMLAGAGITLNSVLRLGFDSSESAARILEPLGFSLSSALLGALVLAYHYHAAIERSVGIDRTARLLVSGVALVAAASGIGVIANALLVPFGIPLAGSGVHTLLIGGLSSFIVGAPLWWLVWKPAHRTDFSEGLAGRRIYLIAVFGLSAVSALVTLLVLGYRLFEFALADHVGGAFIDRVRAPLGLFIATALVAAYHFSVWRQDRAVAPLPGKQGTIDQVILVASGDGVELKRLIEEQTGATVKLWRRKTIGSQAPTHSSDSHQDIPSSGPPLDLLAEALKNVKGKRVLVVTGSGTAIEVIPLAD